MNSSSSCCSSICNSSC